MRGSLRYLKRARLTKRFPSRTTPVDDYVDALREDRDALLAESIIIRSPEEVWGIRAAWIPQSRIAQAMRFRE